jgi:hypothetical protein
LDRNVAEMELEATALESWFTRFKANITFWSSRWWCGKLKPKHCQFVENSVALPTWEWIHKFRIQPIQIWSPWKMKGLVWRAILRLYIVIFWLFNGLPLHQSAIIRPKMPL